MIKRLLKLCDCKGCYAKARVEYPTKTAKGLVISRFCNSCNEEYKRKGFIVTR